MAKSFKAIKISQKHLLGIQDLSILDVETILDESKKFKGEFPITYHPPGELEG